MNDTQNESESLVIKPKRKAKTIEPTEGARIKTRSITVTKKAKETKEDIALAMVMPTKDNYSMLLSFNYTIKQLKEIATHHKIKFSSSLAKADIVNKIYNYFKHYDNAVVIQKAWRRYLLRQFNKLRGPARFNRRLCVNETDFFTMDDLKDIPYGQFFSFQDADTMIYGFDVLSIYTLFHKRPDTDNKTANPYNRNVLSKQIKKNVLKLLWFSRLYKEEINISMGEDTVKLQTIQDRATTLFHDIDILGNYTNVNWFLSLGQTGLVRFLVELNDIWSYRANLSDTVKAEICPNHRDLFRMMYMMDIRIVSLATIQDIVLNVMEMLVRDGINRDSRCLGANFVLCGLTLVNAEAAIALPWLFHSVL
jgi:hypothetical protein